jgi:hypothetical protein
VALAVLAALAALGHWRHWHYYFSSCFYFFSSTEDQSWVFSWG